MTHEELMSKRAALVAARSVGALEAEFRSGGTVRRVTYRSISEIQMAIDAIDRDIAANAGTRIRQFLPTFSKGFDN